MSIPDPISALVAFLTADAGVAALVVGRVYGVELDSDETPNQPRNAVLVKPVPAAGMRVGYMALGSNSYDIWCLGPDPYQAGQVRLAVYEALKLLNREISNDTLLHWAQEIGGVISFRDPDTDWPVQMQTFQVLVAEVATA